jgi:hypothetical protein
MVPLAAPNDRRAGLAGTGDGREGTVPLGPIDEQCVNTIRTLAMDAVQRAMCGRLRIGMGFLHACSSGRSSHVFGLLARFT